MTYKAPKELTLDPEFRKELYELYKKRGYVLTWISSIEYNLTDLGNVYEIDYGPGREV